MRCGISNGKRLENRKHLETQIYPQLYTGVDPPKGAIYDKKPFRMEVQAGKVYLWCSCGQSKTQVSHYNINFLLAQLQLVGEH